MIKLVRGLAGATAVRPAGLSRLAAARAVLWSFFGVRKMRHLEADSLSITPLAAIGAGLAVAFVFVLTLIGIVRLVTG